jgi:hypothetical protein
MSGDISNPTNAAQKLYKYIRAGTTTKLEVYQSLDCSGSATVVGNVFADGTCTTGGSDKCADKTTPEVGTQWKSNQGTAFLRSLYPEKTEAKVRGKAKASQIKNNVEVQKAKKAADDAFKNADASPNSKKAKMSEYGEKLATEMKKQTVGVTSRDELKNLLRQTLKDAESTEYTDADGKKVRASFVNKAEDIMDSPTRTKLKISSSKKLVVGGDYTPQNSKANAESNCADLSSLNADEEAYVPLDVDEFVCFKIGEDKVTFKQATADTVLVGSNTFKAGETYTKGAQTFGIGSVVTTSSDDGTTASAGAATKSTAFAVWATMASLLVFFFSSNLRLVKVHSIP